LLALNALFVISIKNSKKEVESTIMTIARIYKDQELSEYFNEEKAGYYTRRYNLWLTLIPALMLFSIGIAIAIEYLA
jgi:hypothetical protein